MQFSRRNLLKVFGGSAVSMTALSLLSNPVFANATQGSSNETINPRQLKIGVIGAGWLGGTVGRCLVQAGYEVMFSSRNLDRVRRDIQGLGDSAKVGTPLETANFADVILFAVPHTALVQVAKDVESAIKGKIIIDATNTNGDAPAVMRATNGNVPLFNALLLPNTRLVRAFSSVDATQIEASFRRNGRNPLPVPIASDDAEALAIVAQMVRDIHSVPISVGALENAIKYQRGTPAFRRHTNEADVRAILGV